MIMFSVTFYFHVKVHKEKLFLKTLCNGRMTLYRYAVTDINSNVTLDYQNTFDTYHRNCSNNKKDYPKIKGKKDIENLANLSGLKQDFMVYNIHTFYI